MINITSFLFLVMSSSNIGKEGGLFDFNATLPLMAVQFLFLMIILNIIFYKPVTIVLDNRDEYIRNSLTSASASLSKADQLTSEYEQQLMKARREAQELIRSSQKIAQQNVFEKIKEAQTKAEFFINEASQQLTTEKQKVLKTLEAEINTISNKIKNKLLEEN
jgi:F-type H+-transporting ATPase subunit b|uniref:ATP synthase CFO B' chain subunit II n=1 Tax=Thorea hispida TaxID=202687 RepID=A0A1C9CAE0_9FLOR|nr:ATP synthase CFO B' chain subunit II [Thorea hispida]AOM65337.1 ATP synthase CFO B' chain subunit II [Thorea hispida]ARX95897.1 ATP synthase CFO B' chain subunit II [Thorea hispida]UNJ79182.1 ATP synthase CFO B' chain subunit II [Thorea hispida]